MIAWDKFVTEYEYKEYESCPDFARRILASEMTKQVVMLSYVFDKELMFKHVGLGEYWPDAVTDTMLNEIDAFSYELARALKKSAQA